MPKARNSNNSLWNLEHGIKCMVTKAQEWERGTGHVLFRGSSNLCKLWYIKDIYCKPLNKSLISKPLVEIKWES